MKKSISIIVPVFNEEKVLKEIIYNLKSIVFGMNIDYEIIVVNDGSSDKSSDILEKIDDIKVIKHSSNKGYGASLKTGIKNSKYDWILITDSDGTYPMEDIPKLISKIKENDMVVGSREKKGNAIPFERKHAKKFLNKYASYLAGKKIPDLNSGFRVFRKDIVYKYWKLFPEKFSFTSTITMVCLSHGYQTKFVPIEYHKRTGKSSIKPTDFFNFLRLVTKLSLFFRPIRVFLPISVIIFFISSRCAWCFYDGICERVL